MRSHLCWRGERKHYLQGCGNLTSRHVLKMTISNAPNQTIFVGGRLESLQMVLKLDTGQCACEIAHRLERGTNHSL